MLYVPFMPAVLLSLPAMYFFSTPVDPMLLKSCNLLQYYSSGLLCFNAFFTQGTLLITKNIWQSISLFYWESVWPTASQGICR